MMKRDAVDAAIFRRLEDAPVLDMCLVVFRVGMLVEAAADWRLRLLGFGPDNAVELVFAADPGVTAEEVDGARAEAEQRSHPGVVIVRGAEVTVGAVLGGALAAGGVREMWIERLAAVTFAADGLDLRIDLLAVRVLR